MKFKTDENLPEEIARILRQEHYDSLSVREQKLSGEDDKNIAEICLKEDRVLITLDTDFSDIRTYPPQNYPGIIVLRLQTQGKLHVINSFQRIVPLLKQEPLARHLWIVDEHRIRIHEPE